MPTNVDAIIAKLKPAQRKKVEARAAQLIVEERNRAAFLLRPRAPRNAPQIHCKVRWSEACPPYFPHFAEKMLNS